MGTSQSIQKINFEDVQYGLKQGEKYIFINTLPENEQSCLIPSTLNPQQEESIINNLLKHGRKDVSIIVYGANCNDDKLYTKYNQLVSLGFHNVYIYSGGLFEWLMLQDIYGFKEFPTTIKQLDFLKYKPKKRLNISLLEY